MANDRDKAQTGLNKEGMYYLHNNNDEGLF